MYRSALLSVLLFASVACVSPAPTASSSKSDSPAANGKAESKSLTAEERSKAEMELRELERDRQEALLGLRLTSMKAEAEKREGGHSVEDMARKLKDSREALASYREVEAPLERADVQLGVDRAESRLESARQDLQGILEIYEGEEEARAKQEIIRRNQKSVEFAQKALENARAKARKVGEFDIPAKISKLEWEIGKAEREHNNAISKTERIELEGMKDLQSAENKVASLNAKIERTRVRLGLPRGETRK